MPPLKKTRLVTLRNVNNLTKSTKRAISSKINHDLGKKTKCTKSTKRATSTKKGTSTKRVTSTKKATSTKKTSSTTTSLENDNLEKVTNCTDSTKRATRSLGLPIFEDAVNVIAEKRSKGSAVQILKKNKNQSVSKEEKKNTEECFVVLDTVLNEVIASQLKEIIPSKSVEKYESNNVSETEKTTKEVKSEKKRNIVDLQEQKCKGCHCCCCCKKTIEKYEKSNVKEAEKTPKEAKSEIKLNIVDNLQERKCKKFHCCCCKVKKMKSS